MQVAVLKRALTGSRAAGAEDVGVQCSQFCSAGGTWRAVDSVSRNTERIGYQAHRRRSSGCSRQGDLSGRSSDYPVFPAMALAKAWS
jgi:hypothetical protein